MDKILVTGSTGFVGRKVIEALLREGVEVIATVRKLSLTLSGGAGLEEQVEIGDLNQGV